jgi:hypothetical protein
MSRIVLGMMGGSIAAYAYIVKGVPMVSLLIYIIVIVLLLSVAWWAVTTLGVPEPMAKFIRIVLVLVAVIALIYLLLPLAGTPTLPK